MPYVITATSWKNVNPGFDLSELQEGETFVDEVPQWLIDWDEQNRTDQRLAEAENVWQASEILQINNQLMALEEAEATGEDTGALPGTRVQWLQYRTKVRNWKDGADYFPIVDHRPIRPY